MTGPMLPRSVESNVEQYLKYSWLAPLANSHAAAAADSATATLTGAVRVLSDTTTASTSGAEPDGTPNVCTTVAPPRRKTEARSVPPVASSAMTPSLIIHAATRLTGRDVSYTLPDP